MVRSLDVSFSYSWYNERNIENSGYLNCNTLIFLNYLFKLLTERYNFNCSLTLGAMENILDFWWTNLLEIEYRYSHDNTYILNVIISINESTNFVYFW